MSEEKQTAHFCNVNEDGICGMHEIEVERRNVDRNRLNDLRNDFKDFKQASMNHIANLCTFKNRLIGVGVLGTIIVLGNYGWTVMVKQELHSENLSLEQELKSEVEELHRDIVELNTRTESKFSAVLLQVGNNRTEMAVVASQIATTNDRLREVINLMEKDRRDLEQDRRDFKLNGNR